MSEENVSIKIGADYFRRCSINEYSNPLPFIWIREAVQNSVDAGAKNINIHLEEGLIRVNDDGYGMSKKTLINKLLVLGGSQKEEGATGGFGKAKEVLFFCWNYWELNTYNSNDIGLHVNSEMIGKAPVEEINGIGRKGTSIMIQFPEEELPKIKWDHNIRFFVGSCSTDTNIYLNGELLPTMDRRGSKQEMEWATIRVNKSIHSDKIFVRINGITMFWRHLYGELPAQIMVDLKGNSVDILSSSRESMKSAYQRELDNYVNYVTSNPKTAVDNKPKTGYLKYEGVKLESIKDTVDNIIETSAEAQEATEEIIAESKRKAKEEFENIVQKNTQNGITDYKAVEKEVEKITCFNTEDSKKIVDELNKQNISALGYEFIVKGKIKRTGTLDTAMDPNSYKSLKIMHYWKNTVLKVLQDNDIEGEFGVGFIFEEGTNAQLTTLEGKKYFLINPTIIKKTSNVMGLGTFIFPKACHEIAHLWDSNHNENFTSAHGKLMEGLGENFGEWKKLFNKTEEEVKERVKNN